MQIFVKTSTCNCVISCVVRIILKPKRSSNDFMILKAITNTASDVDEWAILEFQGELKLEDPFEEPPDYDFIGDLHYNKQGKPVMIIGHHMLQGEQLMMEKPIAVLERQHPSKLDGDGREIREFYVKAIVKKKLLFRDRPKPIVVSAPKS